MQKFFKTNSAVSNLLQNPVAQFGFILNLIAYIIIINIYIYIYIYIYIFFNAKIFNVKIPASFNLFYVFSLWTYDFAFAKHIGINFSTERGNLH
jgi:hypothetical protein